MLLLSSYRVSPEATNSPIRLFIELTRQAIFFSIMISKTTIFKVDGYRWENTGLGPVFSIAWETKAETSILLLFPDVLHHFFTLFQQQWE